MDGQGAEREQPQVTESGVLPPARGSLAVAAAVAAAPVPRAAAQLPEPLPLPVSRVGSAQDHALLGRLLPQRLSAPAAATLSPALLPALAALLLPLLPTVLHALSPQPLPGRGDM